MKHKQTFLIEHDRDKRIKPGELYALLRREYHGIIREGKMLVKELKSSPHTISSMRRFR